MNKMLGCRVSISPFLSSYSAAKDICHSHNNTPCIHSSSVLKYIHFNVFYISSKPLMLC